MNLSNRLYIAKLNRMVDQKPVYRYWFISTPVISMFVLSLLYNATAWPILLAPHPLLYANRYALLVAWLLLLVGTNIAVETKMYKSLKQ